MLSPFGNPDVPSLSHSPRQSLTAHMPPEARRFTSNSSSRFAPKCRLQCKSVLIVVVSSPPPGAAWSKVWATTWLADTLATSYSLLRLQSTTKARPTILSDLSDFHIDCLYRQIEYQTSSRTSANPTSTAISGEEGLGMCLKPL